MDKYVLISKSVKRNAAFPYKYITVDVFHRKVRVLLMCALILHCAASMFRDTRNILSKHFSSVQNHQLSPKFPPKL